jgi:hypothetical protein
MAAADEVLPAASVNTLPATLYHFTDADGLIGILKRRVLFASLAVALNDPSETSHAIDVCRSLIDPTTTDPFDLRLLDLMNRTKPHGIVLGRSHAYVVSFCAADDLAFHWLHYGRDGQGFAVEVDPHQLVLGGGDEADDFKLVPVVYELAEQQKRIGLIINAVRARYQTLLGKLYVGLQPRLVNAAATVCMSHVRRIAAEMKHPAFRGENEWRLLRMEREFVGVRSKKTPEIKFRAAGARVIPYLEYSFRADAIREVVIGFSNPMPLNDQALAILWRETLGGPARIRRSDVPVR